MLDVCDLPPYETSRWFELKPDRKNVTCSGTGRITCGMNATPEWVHRDGQDWIRMSARAYMSSHGHDAIVVGCTELLFQPSFSLCCLTRCLQSLSSTRWLRYCVGEQRTMRITTSDTAQSERALVRLIGTSSWEAVCIKPWKDCCAHVIHELTVTSCVVFSPDTRRQLIVPSEPSLRAW